jgi:alkylresorcinol/alkylpyrone synthase
MESVSIRQSNNGKAVYPTVAATATALPPYTITRDDVKVYMGRVFDIAERRLEAMMSIVDNAQVHKRHSIFPLDYTIQPRPLSQTNNEYIEHAVKLGREASEKCLERAGLKPADIDMIITVSCTGFMIPSLDAHLINQMGFRSDVRRMPFTELGCAAGAMALAWAADFLKTKPGGNVLIISVELPSLTFQRKDISQANLISSILFGDGAAAVVVTGKEQQKGPKILVTETYTFPDSLNAMGFDLRDSGFHILLSKDVPEMIGGKIGG